MPWIEKQRYIIDFALSSLMRRWKKNIALVAVYTLVVFVLASVVFFTGAIRKEAKAVLEACPDIIVQRTLAGRQDLIPSGYRDTLGRITGVSAVRGRLWAYYFDPSVGANYTIVVTDRPLPKQGVVSIGQGVSRAIHAGRGDTISLKGHDGSYLSFEVGALFPGSCEFVSADLIEMSEKDFRDLFGIPEDRYTDMALSVRNARERVVVSDKIRRVLPDTRPVIKEEILRTYDAVFSWRSGLLLVIFTGAILAFLIFSWDKATGLSIQERREIGILKAVGWETVDIISLRSWEGVIISLSSFLAGILLAYVHVFFASSTIFEPVLKGWAVIYPEFSLTPVIDPYHISALFFLTVIPYTVATIIPSWLAATLDPDSVMRL
ncbi:MAG TPA: FtsX-like permease family protein [Deltaproteobacteria bacterium]|nr:FtsX-like permease family protein [Deltaproteobacteria bacterium]